MVEITKEMVSAALTAYNRQGYDCVHNDRECIRAALSAALPLIERAVREEVAGQLRQMALANGGTCAPEAFAAAAIRNGSQP